MYCQFLVITIFFVVLLSKPSAVGHYLFVNNALYSESNACVYKNK